MGCVDSSSRPIPAAEEMIESAHVLNSARTQLLSVCWAGTVVADEAQLCRSSSSSSTLSCMARLRSYDYVASNIAPLPYNLLDELV